MSVGKDNLFGVMAERLNYVTGAQVKECLGIQQKMRGMGIDEPLGEILTKKGYITDQQARAVLRAMGITTEQIPGYQLVTKIGQGGMGTVYKATQTSVNRAVAIKVLSSLMTQDPSYVARFLAEGRAAAALSHRNIILAIDAGEANGNYFFVMEYFPGDSLRELIIKQGPCDEKRAIDVARQVAEALDYLHQRKMVHRDIKPENVMIGEGGAVKICDFGLARQQQSEQSLTQTGFAVGTPYYMSPEQVTGEKDVDIRADLYSLGATLYYAVTGRFVFEGNTAAETMSLHLNQPAPNPKTYAPKLSDDFVHIVHKLLEKDRGFRYQTPRELIEDLDGLRGGAAPHHARQHAAARAVKSHHKMHVLRRRPASVAPLAIGLALAIVVIGLVIVVSNGGPSPAGNGTAPPAPPPVAATTAAPPPPPATTKADPPKVDAEREDKAGILFERGRKEFDQKKWREAKASLELLLRDFDTTQLVDAKRPDVRRMLGECASALADQMRDLDRRAVAARALMKPGTWLEARDALLKLRQEGLETEQVTAAGLAAEIRACAAVVPTEAAPARIRTAMRDQRWDAALADAADFRRQHARTSTGRAVDAEVAAWSTKAQLELDAQKAIADAKLAEMARNWEELMRLLEAIERTYHGTMAYANSQGTRDELRRRHMQAKKDEMEADAKASWSKAEAEFREGLAQNRWEAAEQALRAWEQKYKLTDEYKRLAQAVQTHFKTLASTRTRVREGDAQEHVKALRDAVAKRFWEDGVRAAEALQREYADTKVARESAASIKLWRETCEREGGIGPHVVWRLEFEEDKDALAFMGDANAKPKFEWSPDGYNGKRAGAVTFLAYDSGEYSWLVQEFAKGLPAPADTVTVALRATKKSAGLTVRLMIAEFNPTEEFVYDVTVGSEWKRHSIKLSDFRKQYGDGNGKPDPDRLRRIGFAQREKNEAQEFLVDSLRVEAKK